MKVLHLHNVLQTDSHKVVETTLSAFVIEIPDTATVMKIVYNILVQRYNIYGNHGNPFLGQT